MAFYFTADSTTGPLEVVGSFTDIAYGSVVLAGGTATVTVPKFSVVKMAVASSQTSNAARCSATATNTFTITGTGTDRVDWIAIGRAKS
jgi:hypothetical protein